MRKTTIAMFCVCFAFGVAGLLLAQGKKRASPHETTSATIGGHKITIEYGRPYKKGRKIFGGLEPFGKVWRTGADEATVLATAADLTIGTLKVPKGSYGLFTIPGQEQWTLVINKVAKQWGAFEYNQSEDVGRAAMKVESLAQPLEQLTIAIEPRDGNQGLLKITWDTTAASVPIVVH